MCFSVELACFPFNQKTFIAYRDETDDKRQKKNYAYTFKPEIDFTIHWSRSVAHSSYDEFVAQITRYQCGSMCLLAATICAWTVAARHIIRANYDTKTFQSFTLCQNT